ncbi:MAG: hypothetical protein M1285_05640 [Candidatus Thermoplasmatota archaeon]|nr:hypothetical protein [Candidatus Thermoplasmatota archaeon]
MKCRLCGNEVVFDAPSSQEAIDAGYKGSWMCGCWIVNKARNDPFPGFWGDY